MESESEKPKKASKNLSYNMVLGIGIGLTLIGAIVGGIIGTSIGLAGDIFSWVSIIMIIINTFKKSIPRKTKWIGWLMVLLWIIAVAIRSQIT